MGPTARSTEKESSWPSTRASVPIFRSYIILISKSNTNTLEDIQKGTMQYFQSQMTKTELKLMITSNTGHHLAGTFWTYGRIFKISINKITKYNTVICFAQHTDPELVAFVLGVMVHFDNVNLKWSGKHECVQEGIITEKYNSLRLSGDRAVLQCA